MKYFCKAPFTQMSIDPDGAVLPCCRYTKALGYLKDERIDDLWNNENYQNLRLQFLNGEKPKECSDCWHAEESGDQSLRTTQNYWARNMNFTRSHVDMSPLYYEFKTTNVCNLKCRMCGAINSSQIAKEESPKEIRKHYLSNKIIGTHHEPILKDWLDECRYILFAGGEPLVNNEIKAIADYLDENNLLENIEVLVVTNGTHYDEKFVDQFKKIKKFRLRISLDDINERNDYQREGSDFNIIQENVLKFKKDFDDIMFNCTINWYNIWDIGKFFDYCDGVSIPVSVQFVENPEYLNVSNLPLSIKNMINKKYKDSADQRIKIVLNRMNLSGSDMLENFRKHVTHYDLLRNNNFHVKFPEWSSILNNVR